jgi:hypothetical protein
MMERSDAIGFVMMNSLCRNCFQTGCFTVGDYLSLDSSQKSPPSGTVGREINYRYGERSVFIH